MTVNNSCAPTAPHSMKDLFDRLQVLEIETETVHHDAVFTVEESSKAEITLPGAHTKNLFLKDAKGRLFLVIADHQTAIDLKALPSAISSKRLSFGKPELLMNVLGVTPGSVTAFAVINDTEQQVTVIIDANLLNFESINCHPLQNDATTNIALEDLFRFIRACGHDYNVIALPG